MKQSVVLDTGPLVALLDSRDQYHVWTRNLFSDIEPPLLTCDAVLSEACFLVRKRLGNAEPILKLVEIGVVRLAFSLDENWREVSSLMRRFNDVPMSLADACLVRMSELVENCTVLTLDADFHIYRRLGRKSIPLLIPRASS